MINVIDYFERNPKEFRSLFIKFMHGMMAMRMEETGEICSIARFAKQIKTPLHAVRAIIKKNGQVSLLTLYKIMKLMADRGISFEIKYGDEKESEQRETVA